MSDFRRSDVIIDEERLSEAIRIADQRWERRWLCCLCNKKLIVLAAVVAVIVVVSVVARPTKPGFVLLDGTVLALNASDPNLITSEFQLTLRSSNPNHHIGIFYDGLVVYASFYDQQITHSTTIPSTYQEKNGVNIWSPQVSGVSIPIARFTWASLKQDRTTTMNFPILFELDGWVKWKFPPFSGSSYHIHVNCQTYIPIFSDLSSGVPFINTNVKYQLNQGCTVSE